jgi:TonB-dependent SusC/RagA subfamily outer membrane receptor
MNRFLLPFLVASQMVFAQKAINNNSKISNIQSLHRIRCAATQSNFSEPLIIIDGVLDQSTELKKIDPVDIVSIDILKGSYAADLYGAKGINGVIIIETKRQNVLVVQDGEDNSKLSGATLKVLASDKDEGIFLGADKNGEIDIKQFRNRKECKLEVSCIGYKTKTVDFVKGQSGNFIKLEKDYKVMSDIIIVGYPEIYCRSFCCICPSTTIEKTTFSQDSVILPAIKFLLYPNPVFRSNQLTVKFSQGLKGKIDIINSAGQVVQSLNLNGGKNLYSTFQLKLLTAGVYFVRVSDGETQKCFTEKLIVQ